MPQEKIKAKKIKLKPTLREKRHYLVLAIETGKELSDKEIKTIIQNSILEFIGTLGYAKAGPLFIETGKMKKGYYIIVSVLTKYVDHVKGACALIHEKGLSIRCIGVSGTIKKSRRFL